MSNFKVGDRVIRVGSSLGEMVEGRVYTVKSVQKNGIRLKGREGLYGEEYFNLVESHDEVNEGCSGESRVIRELLESAHNCLDFYLEEGSSVSRDKGFYCLSRDGLTVKISIGVE